MSNRTREVARGGAGWASASIIGGREEITLPRFVAERIMIAQADVGPMHGIDEIKISPHEPVAPIDRGAAAAGDTAPGIESAASGETVLLQMLRAHAARLKWDPVIAVALVEPPGFVEETPFIGQT